MGTVECSDVYLPVDSGQMAWIPTELPAGLCLDGKGYVIDLDVGNGASRSSEVSIIVLPNMEYPPLGAVIAPRSRTSTVNWAKKGLVVASTGRIYIGDPCYYHRGGGTEEFARTLQRYQVCLMGTRWTQPLRQKLKSAGYRIRKGIAGDPCILTTTDKDRAIEVEAQATALLDAEPYCAPSHLTMEESISWRFQNLSYAEAVSIDHCYLMVMHVNHGRGHEGGAYPTRLGQAVTVRTAFGDGFYPLRYAFMPPWAWLVSFR